MERGGQAPAGAAGDAGGVVALPVHCRRCGYNQYGLPADGHCPECGLETWESILHTVDPAASRLPKLHSPRVVGDALLWLMVCLAVSMLLVVAEPVARWLDALDRSGLLDLEAWARPELAYVAAAAAVAALYAVHRLAPPRDAEPGAAERRDVRVLGAGLLGWAVFAGVVPILEGVPARRWVIEATWLAAALAAAVALLGLRGVLRAIGLRSREYRTARGGRQGIRAMMVAIAGTALGQAMRAIASLAGVGALETIGLVVVNICTLMVAIGLGYLLVNVWWIRRALRRPPPRLEDLVRPT